MSHSVVAHNQLPDDAELPSAKVKPSTPDDPSRVGQEKDYAVIVRIRGTETGYLTGHSVEGATSNLERSGLLQLAIQHLQDSLPSSID